MTTVRSLGSLLTRGREAEARGPLTAEAALRAVLAADIAGTPGWRLTPDARRTLARLLGALRPCPPSLEGFDPAI